jgi:protein-S-isoprenylcysteine O-methyltransferase Ste14
MSRLPTLGPRGEGWLVAQIVLFWLIVATALLGPAWSGIARVTTSLIGGGLLGVGLTLAARGLRDLRGALTPLPYPRDDAELVETGIYAHVRHPIYGGVILGAVGWGLLTASIPTLGLAAVLWGFFQLKSRREEVWLEERFPGYPAYRQRTRRLIPWIG